MAEARSPIVDEGPDPPSGPYVAPTTRQLVTHGLTPELSAMLMAFLRQYITDRHHDAVLAAVSAGVATITERIEKMSGTLQQSVDTLTAEVTRQTTINQSALTLIQGFAARLQAAIDAATAAGASPAQLEQLVSLSASMTSNDDALAAAVAANTPVVATPTGQP